ncbi:MAG: hypothetical protein KAJ90_07745 [Desulfobacterales bacterium]|nr:hypothetical protein [Desulfobacterales bacterium]
MRDDEILDWYGAGYDAFPDADLAQAPQGSEDGSGLLKAAIALARRGSFDLVSKLASDVVAQTSDVLLHWVACDVVGDAGNAADLETLVQALGTTKSFEQRLDMATALASRGRLVDVPVVFRFYELEREHPDAQAIHLSLNWLLCDPDEPFDVPVDEEEWSEYRTQVGARYFGLWNDFGTNLIHIHHGRIFDIGRIVEGMLKGLSDSILNLNDRHVFEITTGLSCSKWFTDEKSNLLQAAADLERFAESGKAAAYPPGQRAFMGHLLEDVGAAAQILDAYPPNRGLGVPAIRTTFDVDDDFGLEFGFEPMFRGYFFQTPKPPPSAELTIDKDWPWLSLHTCLREAMSGNRDPLEGLATLLDLGNDGAQKVHPQWPDMFRHSVINLLADAADDRVIAPWREVIKRGDDPALTFALCWGLLRRGMLRDVPLVLEAYRLNPENPDYAYLEGALNCLLAFSPITLGPHERIGVKACCYEVTRRYEMLCSQLGRDDIPVYRGELHSVVAIAREVIELKHGPKITADLRTRFEASTGIDCTDWEGGPEGFNAQRAAAAAQKFLDSDESAKYLPGQLYFFGRAIGHGDHDEYDGDGGRT